MDIGIHLNFPRTCKEAFKTYADLFEGQLKLFTTGGSPSSQNVPEEWQGKIVHGNLKIEGMEIAGCDLIPSQFKPPQGFSILVELKEIDRVRKIFSALSQDGTAIMEPQKTFWSLCHSVVTDKWGITWEVYSEA